MEGEVGGHKDGEKCRQDTALVTVLARAYSAVLYMCALTLSVQIIFPTVGELASAVSVSPKLPLLGSEELKEWR